MTEEMNNAEAPTETMVEAPAETMVEAPAEGTEPSIPDPTVETSNPSMDIPLPDDLRTVETPRPSAPAGVNPHDISRAVEQGFSAILERFEQGENEGEIDPEKPLTKRELEEYKKSMMQEVMQSLHYEKERVRLESEAEREESKYLGSVEASIAAIIPPEHENFEVMRELSRSKMTELLSMAQVELGRRTLTPGEVKAVKKIHWELFQPTLVKYKSRIAPVHANPAQKNVSLAGTTASRGSFPSNQNTSGVNKAVEEYNKKKEKGGLSLEEALAFNLGFTVNS